MRVEYGDEWQAAIRDRMTALTLSKLLAMGDTSIVFGRFDADTGDETIVSSERIDDGQEDSE